MKPHTWQDQPEQQHMFGGGGAPAQSKTAKENEKLNNQLLRQQLSQIGKEQHMPALPPIPAPQKIAPPPSATPADAEAASREAQRRVRMRRGFEKSRLGAGDTGAKPSSPPTSVAQGTKPTLG